ncbi:MAG: leucyl/phenylalanyl-tRNA--protein transferase [Acidimicrobiales bacterium]
MPIEPPATRWDLSVDLLPDELGFVGAGADDEPGTLLAAYRSALFPMPLEGGGVLGWWSPDPRGVLELDNLHISRSLRRSMRHFEFRVDSAFDEVVAGCAEPTRPYGWIDDRIQRAYRRLHELGWAHSVETWCDGELVGGLYGLGIGGLFAAESKFHRRTDASKAAVVALATGLVDDHPRLIDVQWRTDHLASLGVTEISRSQYLERLHTVLSSPDPQLFVNTPHTITNPLA